ncbi:MAG TPA: DegT/DnrJ/EryC1/StrS aminotransferase family protein [Anaerolineaceae bacterium]|nr:DegT/DnrJ/EryC1/StrS aminotransferase family protein [Anaerolineaceae bacterium]
MNWRIPLADLNFGEEEKEAVMKVLDSRWLTMGEETQNFEREFARYLGVKHAVAVANGTASLHLACLALGLKPGDEVLVPSLTFVATAASIVYAGARPVFVDIAGETNTNISVESIEARITPRTRAIMVMHYGGYPCDMPRILEIAGRYGLALIEDAAHAPGAAIGEKKIGNWSNVASFSFFSNKNLATGEGGMVVTNDDEIARKVRLQRSHAMTTMTWDRHKGHASSYEVVDLGFNYRIDEIRSAIGRIQLKKLDGNNTRRGKLTAAYRAAFQKLVPEIEIPFEQYPFSPAYHLLPILLPAGVNRFAFMEGMKAQGIQTSIHYPPIHQFNYYRNRFPVEQTELPVTESVGSREVTLPLYADLDPASVCWIVETTRNILQEIPVERSRSVW